MKLYEHTYYLAEKYINGHWKRQPIEDESMAEVEIRIKRIIGAEECRWRIVAVTEIKTVACYIDEV